MPSGPHDSYTRCNTFVLVLIQVLGSTSLVTVGSVVVGADSVIGSENSKREDVVTQVT